MTLTAGAERLAVDLSLPVLKIKFESTATVPHVSLSQYVICIQCSVIL